MSTLLKKLKLWYTMDSGGDKVVNNKGFTLIELLATLVILSLVLGISVYGVTGAINNSKARGEKLFVESLGKAIDGYISLKGTSLRQSGGICATFAKKNNIGNSTYEVSLYLLKKSDGGSIYILDLVNEGLVDQAKLINPKNKKQCFDTSHNPEVKIYQDSDYVYYYSVDLGSNLCDLESKHLVLLSDSKLNDNNSCSVNP